MDSLFDTTRPTDAILELHRCYNLIKCEEIWQRIVASNFSGYVLRLLEKEHDKKIIELGPTFYYQRPSQPQEYVSSSDGDFVLVGAASVPLGFFSRTDDGNVQLNNNPVGTDKNFEFNSDGDIRPKG